MEYKSNKTLDQILKIVGNAFIFRILINAIFNSLNRFCIVHCCFFGYSTLLRRSVDLYVAGNYKNRVTMCYIKL
ncbi:unnamed protein product [Rhizophagus irregularis]|nr:unnamed protein product [Rhizophagus irregularis]